jgi:serine/threonine-protein kinase
MLVDEARLASRIVHPNVVSTIDVLSEQDEVLLVMEYVAGESVATLLRMVVQKNRKIPPSAAASIIGGTLRGLHAAHEARAEDGSTLGIVHRDISPQNIMVGIDGVAKVLDFGVAKAALRSQTTKSGHIKGKFAYMAPEQLLDKGVDARTDVFACGVVLWECLTLRRLFSGNDMGETIKRLLSAPIPPPSQFNPRVSPQLDAVVLRALEREPGHRYQTAAEFADALESAVRPARPVEVGQWVRSIASDSIRTRALLLADIECNRHAKVGVVQSSTPEQRGEGLDGFGVSTQMETQHSRRTLWRRMSWLGVGLGVAVGCFVWLGPAVVSKQLVQGATAISLPPASAALGVDAAPAASVTRAAVSQGTPEDSAVTQEPQSVGVTTKPPLALPLTSATPDSPKASSTAARVSTRMTVKRSAQRKLRSSNSKCEPPYRIDERGIRRVLPECL